jgi:pilus assembly protein Flp/PilA
MCKDNLYKFQSYLKDENGATSIEYSVIAAVISVSIVTAVGTLGDKVVDLFELVDTKIKQ